MTSIATFETIFNNGFGLFKSHVRRSCMQFKVLNPIIKFISVDVVYDFLRKLLHLTSKVLIHNVSVLKHTFTVNCNTLIPIVVNVTRPTGVHRNGKSSITPYADIVRVTVSFCLMFLITIFYGTSFHVPTVTYQEEFVNAR